MQRRHLVVFGGIILLTDPAQVLGMINNYQREAGEEDDRDSGSLTVLSPLAQGDQVGKFYCRSTTTFESVVTFVKKTITFSGLGWVARVWWLFPLQQPLQTDIFYRYWPTIHSLIHFKGTVSQNEYFVLSTSWTVCELSTFSNFSLPSSSKFLLASMTSLTSRPLQNPIHNREFWKILPRSRLWLLKQIMVSKLPATVLAIFRVAANHRI